ncbi:hypothetical protein [Actinomadura hibisca]|uniref:hypothetical protein n=1 Tax=Actinomadura hibisca TaxID=68565 RepID=UPI00082D4357|nr:hypothetical protein [Actinomadura hibisca]
MTTEKVPHTDTIGLGTPQGDPETTPARVRDDSARTRDNLHETTLKDRATGKKAWSGAGVAGVAAGLVAVVLWRRHARAKATRWQLAKARLGSAAGTAKATAAPALGTAAVTAGKVGRKAGKAGAAKGKAGAVKAKAKAAETAARVRS